MMISFVILTYNQEHLVKDAIRSALAQKGDPIEIVISDDASSDNTPAVIREVTSAYSGPHRVIVNCNQQNLGIALNFQKAVSLSAGAWIVTAGGDDISRKDRAEVIAKTVLLNPGATAISSGYVIQSEAGCDMPVSSKWHKKMMGMQGWTPEKILMRACLGRPMLTLLGAATAWRRDLFEKFEKLTDLAKGVSEDGVFRWRALMLGRVIILEDQLVTYRRTSQSVTNVSSALGPAQKKAAIDKLLDRALNTLIQARADFVWAGDRNLFPKKRADKCIGRIDHLIGYYMARLRFSKAPATQKLFYLLRYGITGLWRDFLSASK